MEKFITSLWRTHKSTTKGLFCLVKSLVGKKILKFGVKDAVVGLFEKFHSQDGQVGDFQFLIG